MNAGWTDIPSGWERKVGPITLRVEQVFEDGFLRGWSWEALVGDTPFYWLSRPDRGRWPTEPEALAAALAWARETVAEMARAVE